LRVSVKQVVSKQGNRSFAKNFQ